MGISMNMDSAIDFNNVDYSQFDTSYSIAEIVQQQSISNMANTTNETITTLNRNELMVAQAAEKSSRHFVAAILPKKTAAYVFLSTIWCNFHWYRSTDTRILSDSLS